MLPGVGVSAENRGGVIGRRVENGGILITALRKASSPRTLLRAT